MSVSYLASVLIFCMGGIISLWRLLLGQQITGIALTDFVIAAIIFANGVFFLYIELYTETDEAEVKKLRNVHYAQWLLRVVNQGNLTLTWLWLSYGLFYCFLSLFLFYFLILVWDAIVFRSETYKSDENSKGELDIVFHDVVGLGTLFAFAGAVYFFQIANPGILKSGQLVDSENFVRVTILNSFLFLALAAFTVNAYWAIRKTPINIGRLISRERRV